MLSATAAAAQSPGGAPGDESQAVEEIVVTGTSIAGVAPVGSNLVSVGQDALERTAATNVTELVNTIPAITTAGAAPQGENAYSGYAPSIHGIAGSGANTTLTLIDGLRMPGGGTQFAQPDPNIIPTTAIQRVEVLADGASSVYGSDAVSGVVNFITRRTYDGAMINGRMGFGDNYRNYDASAIVGRTWDTGGAYIAAQFTKQGEVANADRPFLSRGDYRDIGGSNTQTFNCFPATIRTPASGNNIYLSPSATTTVANNVSQFGNCNNSIYGAAIPASQRENILATVYQELGERFSILTKVNYNHLQDIQQGTPGLGNNVTAYGPGSGRGGQINPFFMAPGGEAGATQETVNYVLLRPDGDYGTEMQENDTLYTTSVLEYKINDDWTAKLSGALGRSENDRASFDSFCAPCAHLALNGSTQPGGSIAPQVIGGSNVAVTQNLTADNALDVWRPLGSNRTSQAVLDRIYSNDEVLTHLNTFEQVKFDVQGALFDLPAGPLRMAAGGEYMWVKQHVTDTGSGPISSTGTAAQFTVFTLRRSVYSGYAELYAPIVSPEMEIPFVRSFEVNLSARYDHYSDFGGTTNPKIAANWEVAEGVRIRGNYAEAFVAPPLAQVGDPARGFARGAGGAGISGALEVPVALYPEVLAVPGCASATVTCRIGTATNPGLNRQLGAGLAGAKPQLGNSWSAGIDFTDVIPNFRASVTYWSTTFIGGTATPAVELILYSGALHDRLTICPTGCTEQQIRTYTNVDGGAPFTAVMPPTVYFLMDRALRNDLNLDVEGIDAQFEYRIPTDTAGTFTLGANVTYFTKYDQWFLSDPRFSVLNTSGYNSQFPSIQKRGRAQLGWQLGGFTADLYANYTGAYRNWIQTTVNPITLDANRNPSGGGDRVKANVTVDLNLAYELDFGALSGSQVYLNVKNLFDKEPPFYNGNTSGIGVGGWGFNGFVSNPLGRIVSVGFRAMF